MEGELVGRKAGGKGGTGWKGEWGTEGRGRLAEGKGGEGLD